VTGGRGAAVGASAGLVVPDVDAGEVGTGGSLRAASCTGLSVLAALISLPWRAAASADRTASGADAAGLLCATATGAGAVAAAEGAGAADVTGATGRGGCGRAPSGLGRPCP
jgi:hypothetical protein